MAKVVHTTTVAGKGWDGDDIVDIMDDIGRVFKLDEHVVVISGEEYERLCDIEKKFKGSSKT